MTTVQSTNPFKIDFTNPALLQKPTNKIKINNVLNFGENVAEKLLGATRTNQITVNGKTIDIDELKDLINGAVMSEDVNIVNDEALSLLFNENNKYAPTKPDDWRHVIANAELIKANNPLPSTSVVYTFNTDIQPQAINFLNNRSDVHYQELQIGLLGTLLTNALSDSWAFILTDSIGYEKIKNDLNTFVTNNSTDKDLLANNADIQSIPMSGKDCLTTWVTGRSNDPDSINQYIKDVLAQDQINQQIATLPINLNALETSIGFSFINVEALATNDSKHFNKELNDLISLTRKMSVFKIRKFQKIKSASAITSQKQFQKNYTKKSNNNIRRARNHQFHKAAPTAAWQIKRIKQILNSRISKLQTSNTFKNSYTTFMRPNRRHPNDPNLRGHAQRTSFRPDIHIYLDCSGSISEEQYRSGITLLIKLTKSLNTNLYFNSFSHVISQPVLLKTKGQSVKQIYQQIQRIPKVSGGTEYENVWNMVDAIELQSHAKSQAPQVNFMITDFMYDVNTMWIPRLHKASTKDMYYLPLNVDLGDYQAIREWATEFSDELLDKGDVTIKNRIIM